MKLQCASVDDDLGYHNLTVGEDFNWSFCENIFVNTLFFCHIWWGKKERAFEIFKSTHTDKHNRLQLWVAKSDSIYYSNENSTQSLMKVYQWEING